MPSQSAPTPLDFASLACPVRGCGLALIVEGRTLRCANQHAFDLSRRGVANLLQPQDRRAREPGDSSTAIEARRRTLARGLGLPLFAELLALVDELGLPRPRIVDVGCGPGWFLGELAGRRAMAGLGIDLAARATDLAARSFPGLTWIVANADRRMPLRDGFFDVALSLTGPKNPAELQRILAASGRLALAVPAPDDLIELRAAVFGETRAIDRAGRTLALFAPAFELERRVTVRSRPRLEPDALRDLLTGTYRAGRRSREGRAAELGALEVTLSYDLYWLRPRGPA